MSEPSIFDVYNARFLEPREVGRSFILPQQTFMKLCRTEHSILVGPRGSGKTTLLKMLRPTALQSWSLPEKDSIIKGIPFTPVYIGVSSGWDITRSSDANLLRRPDLVGELQKAIIVNHALTRCWTPSTTV